MTIEFVCSDGHDSIILSTIVACIHCLLIGGDFQEREAVSVWGHAILGQATFKGSDNSPMPCEKYWKETFVPLN